MPLWLPILAAVITASATLTATVAVRYFSIKANLPTTAEAFINSISFAIRHAEQRAKGTTFHGGHHRVTPEEFHAFRSNLWPWEMRHVSMLWSKYAQEYQPENEVPALHSLLAEVKRLSEL